MAPNFDGREWNDLGERGNLLAGEGWRYLHGARVRHQIENRAELLPDPAICGVDGEWLGMGNQDEYERLASLPKCLRCMKLLGELDG